MDADQLLNSLGIAMGLQQLAFDEQGCARLMFDGKLAVNLEHEAGSAVLQMYSVVGELPPEDREVLYAMLLKANLFGGETQGATLAVDPLQHEIVLCRTVALEGLPAAAFAAQVEAFVSTTEHWQQRLAGGVASLVAPIAVAPPRMDTFLRG